MGTKKVVAEVNAEAEVTENVPAEAKPVKLEDRKVKLINAGGCSRIRVEGEKWLDVFTGEEIPREIGVQMVE